jgi:hypothetical protein
VDVLVIFGTNTITNITKIAINKFLFIISFL